MRKTIPFKKEILFKTKLKEITSISLEHDYKIDDDLISGEFLVSGDYKMTASSINREEFSYKIPFEIALDSRYDSKTINLDIENFYYEIINEEILKVNIDVFVEGEYQKEEPVIPIVEPPLPVSKPKREEIIIPELKELATNEDRTYNEENILENNITIEPRNENQNLSELPSSQSISNQTKVNIFDNISMEETYSTYHVYIIKEGDTLETVLTKYNVSKEELENYNDLSNIMPYDKIIIPSYNE